MDKLSLEDARGIAAVADASREKVAPLMNDRNVKRFTADKAISDTKQLASVLSSREGECPSCTPDPCDCDFSPSGKETASILPDEMRSQGNLFESETWKEYKAMQGRPATLRRKKMEDTKKRLPGGLPSAPDPSLSEVWEPEELPEEETTMREDMVMPVPAGPSGPTAHEAFAAQKAFDDGRDPQEDLIDPLDYLQANFEGAPSLMEVEQWRSRFGDVYVTGLTDDEVFIWRSVKRLEYKQIMSRVAAAQQAMAKTATAAANADEGRNSMFIEEVCKACVLWPTIDTNQLSFSKAGTLDTLCNLILEGSNFMPHALAVRLTRRL